MYPYHKLSSLYDVYSVIIEVCTCNVIIYTVYIMYVATYTLQFHQTVYKVMYDEVVSYCTHCVSAWCMHSVNVHTMAYNIMAVGMLWQNILFIKYSNKTVRYFDKDASLNNYVFLIEQWIIDYHDITPNRTTHEFWSTMQDKLQKL